MVVVVVVVVVMVRRRRRVLLGLLMSEGQREGVGGKVM